METVGDMLGLIGATHSQSLQVLEQLLLLVYHLGKSSYSIKLESSIATLIPQVALVMAHDEYFSALCELGLEALQMDQFVL